MKQQYRTADGSIWEANIDRVTGREVFDRIDSPDGSHEDDFRQQKLDEVLESWGALSLYDPVAQMRKDFNGILHASGEFSSSLLRGRVADKLAEAAHKMGFELRRRSDA